MFSTYSVKMWIINPLNERCSIRAIDFKALRSSSDMRILVGCNIIFYHPL